MKIKDLQIGDSILVHFKPEYLNWYNKIMAKVQNRVDKSKAHHIAAYVGNGCLAEMWSTKLRKVGIYGGDKIEIKVIRPKVAFNKKAYLESINKDLLLTDEEKDYPEFELFQTSIATLLEFIIESIIKKNIEIPIFFKSKLGTCSRWKSDKFKDAGWDVFKGSSGSISPGDFDNCEDLYTVKEWDEKWTS